VRSHLVLKNTSRLGSTSPDTITRQAALTARCDGIEPGGAMNT